MKNNLPPLFNDPDFQILRYTDDCNSFYIAFINSDESLSNQEIIARIKSRLENYLGKELRGSFSESEPFTWEDRFVQINLQTDFLADHFLAEAV